MTPDERQHHIDFDRNYCTHYAPEGPEIHCAAGQPIDQIQRVSPQPGQPKWGPCMMGHLLPNAAALCPRWERRSLAHAEARADGIERSMRQLETAAPFIRQWRAKPPLGKSEVVECPVCHGKLHLSQSGYNGHVRAVCETGDCLNFVE